MELDIKIINQYIGALALENYLLRSQIEEKDAELARCQATIEDRTTRVQELEQHLRNLTSATR